MDLVLRLTLLLGITFSTAVAFSADTSVLCQKNSENSENIIHFDEQIVTRPNEADEFTVLSWNAYKYSSKNYFPDLKKLAQISDVLMLQEVLHSTSWQSKFTQQLPFSFAFYKSFCTNDDQATGVQSGARFKLMNTINLVSPGREPITNTPKVSGISRIDIPGHGSVLMVNTHALNFNAGNSFEEHITQIANYIATQPGPVIWAGDFNTWNSSRQKFLDKKTKALGFINVNPINDDRRQILDHIYVRGFTVINAEVLKQTSSDHKPLIAVLKFKN